MPREEEEDGEEEGHQTQPLQFDSSDDDDVPLLSMGKRGRTEGSDTSPEGKKRRLMIDSDDDDQSDRKIYSGEN